QERSIGQRPDSYRLVVRAGYRPAALSINGRAPDVVCVHTRVDGQHRPVIQRRCRSRGLVRRKRRCGKQQQSYDDAETEAKAGHDVASNWVWIVLRVSKSSSLAL